MCGIAGLLEPVSRGRAALAARAARMAARLAHRGPDDRGVLVDARTGLALAHTRLAVRDLSALGHQPMQSDDARYTLVYNGELYDADALAANVRAPLRSTCDTEVLLRLLVEDGVERTLPRLSGMFAFAFFDHRARTLTLARDPFGKKPLYVSDTARGLLFASELKALTDDPVFARDIDDESVRLFFRHGVVPGSRSIYARTRQIPPGTYERFVVDGERVRRIEQTRYFSPEMLLARGVGDDGERLDAQTGARVVEGALRDAVEKRLVSDVPVGAFLSSGVDSSLVVALMASLRASRVKTFTIETPGLASDEGPRARALAAHLGTEHHAHAVTAADLLALVDELPRLTDEPFADSSLLPTLLVARHARAHVTVALSGDGADELFCGYRQHAWMQVLAPLTALGGAALRARLARRIEHIAAVVARRAGHAQKSASLDAAWRYVSADAIAKLARALAQGDVASLAAHLRTLFDDDENPRGAPRTPLDVHAPLFRHALHDGLRLHDLSSYLVDDILVKVDRASMSCALEVRSPFLDLDVARAAFALDHDALLPRLPSPSGRDQKRVLRAIVARYVPPSLLAPEKQGFSLPMTEWLRGPLRPLLDDATSSGALADMELRDEPITRLKDAHQSGARAHPQELFAVIAYARWRKSVATRPRTLLEDEALPAKTVFLDA